jgi:hypothetical protein
MDLTRGRPLLPIPRLTSLQRVVCCGVAAPCMEFLRNAGRQGYLCDSRSFYINSAGMHRCSDSLRVLKNPLCATPKSSVVKSNFGAILSTQVAYFTEWSVYVCSMG